MTQTKPQHSLSHHRAWHRIQYGICLILLLAGCARSKPPTLSELQLQWLGERIFQNECAGQRDCLTSWNAGEDFPSLGIGHFIWYRAGQQAPFTETFPALLAYMATQGVPAPAWIAAADYHQPWSDRASFLAAQDGPRLRELRAFLDQHKALQTAFIVARFEQVLPTLLDAADASEHMHISERFQAVAAASPPRGLYALIDYLHFKGDGTRPEERYQGQGWGLLQVLQAMPAGQPVLPAFAASARQVLAQRVMLAPAEREETRWLNGWHNRIATYLPLETARDTTTGADF